MGLMDKFKKATDKATDMAGTEGDKIADGVDKATDLSLIHISEPTRPTT